MSPTPALKSRLSRALVVKSSTCSSPTASSNANRRALVPRSNRKVSIGSDMELSPVRLPQDPEEKEGILLLLGMSTIVKKELANNTEIFHDESEESEESDRPQLEVYLSSLKKRALIPGSPSSLDENCYAWNRARTISIDSPKSRGGGASPKHIPSNSFSLIMPALVTPMGAPRQRNLRKPSLKAAVAHKGKKEKVKFPKLPVLHRHQQQVQQQQQAEETVQEHHRKVQKAHSEKGIPITVIHRKKFSWKVSYRYRHYTIYS